VKTVVKLCALFLLLAPAAVGEVADHFELNASPATGVASNTALEALRHGLSADSVGIWLATGKGVNFSFDGGQTWFIRDARDGLVSDVISALFSVGGRLWAGSLHYELIKEQLFSISDGLSFSDNNGETWTQINFGPSGLDIPFVWGGDRTVYDVTGHIDSGFFNHLADPAPTEWLFFSAFAGGLLASQDGGMHWRRIYPSAMDSVQYYSGGAPSYANRNFSCAVDTSHADTLVLWNGTANGVYQYVFVTPREKLYSRRVNRLAFCDTCSDSAVGGILFVAGDNGFSRGRLTGGPYETRFKDVDGLPGSFVSALIDVGGNLLVGTVDTGSGASAGLAVSTDVGDSFSPVTLPGVVGPDRVISDFTLMNGRLYLAAQTAGLFVSLDDGLSWNPVPLDTLTAPDVNTVNALNVKEDTLLLGTDAGLAALFMDAVGNVDSSSLTPFPEGDSSSSRIIRVKTQVFTDTLDNVDSTIIWTIHRPLSPAGQPMVGRRGLVIDTIANDTTTVWAHLQVGAPVFDVNFFGVTAFVTGYFNGVSVRFTTTGQNPENPFTVRQVDEYGVVRDRLDDDTVTVMELRGDTVLFGSHNGFAYSLDGGLTFTIVRPNLDTLKSDFVINHTFQSSLNFDDSTYGLTGDFIPALGVKYGDAGVAHVWASGRQVTDGFAGGRSVGRFTKPEVVTVVDTVTGDTISVDTVGYSVRWQAVDTSNFAWNFEFVGDSTFSGTDAGLFLDIGPAVLGSSVRVPLVNESTGEQLVDPGTTVLAVEALDTFLWVGTDDGTVRLSLSPFLDNRLIRKVDSADQVYAFPVPFSPGRDNGQTVDFHFPVREAGYVTVEIYDFAMNLVARPIDHVFYEAGIYPGESSQGIIWDGRNGRGDIVAVGVYYFKVRSGSGEERWGKLAVMP